jgi:hypothetical protein
MKKTSVSDDERARLMALPEPEPPWPTRLPVLTIHSARWFVEQIKPYLANEPKFAAAMAEQQLALEAEGQPRAEAVVHVVRNVMAMERDGLKPLDGTSALARAVRLAAERIANGTWRPAPEPHDPVFDSYERAANIARAGRVDVLHEPENVTTLDPGVENEIDPRTGTGTLKLGGAA